VDRYEGHPTIVPLPPAVTFTTVLEEVPTKIYLTTEIIRETNIPFSKRYIHEGKPRKPFPGYRRLPKYAPRVGGAKNRVGEYWYKALQGRMIPLWSHVDLFPPISTQTPARRFPVMHGHTEDATHVAKGRSKTIHTNVRLSTPLPSY